MTEEAKKPGLALLVEILWSGRPHFDVYEVFWTHELEPTPNALTTVMKGEEGLHLVGGGILAWDDAETVAMVVRLQDGSKEESVVESARGRIPPSPVERRGL